MPELEPDITADELEKEVRDELRSLPGDLAELVGKHLVAAERALGEDDTDRAHEHTKVARRFAARIGVVREAAGIVAYRAGHFSEALSDLRAARRMTGSDAYLPIMADCERGMGRPERALDLVRSPEAERLDREGRIELAIVESGARRDLGQHDAAVITLQRLPELRDPQARPWSARLAFAYADALAEAGHQEAATDWFARAMAFDEDGETDAAERYAEITGAVIEDLEEDYEDGDVLDADDDLTGESDRDEDEDDEDDEDIVDSSDSSDAEVDDRLDDDDDDDDDDEDEEDEDEEDEDEEDEDEDDILDQDDEDDEASVGDGLDGVDDDSADTEEVDIEDESDEEGTAAGRAKGESVTEGSAPEAPAALGVGPAFIEPNFGDILDDADEPEDKREA